MRGWKEAYQQERFSISTTRPSRVVVKGLGMLGRLEGARVLDLGCGNGRNTVYAARLGCLVDAVDLAYLGFLEGLDQQTRDRIRFHESDVMDYDIAPGGYQGVIATRLFQYLDSRELSVLLERIGRGLVPGGILMASYTASGGVLDGPEVGVRVFRHPLEELLSLLPEKGLETVLVQEGPGVTTHVPYHKKNEAYDIIARRATAFGQDRK